MSRGSYFFFLLWIRILVENCLIVATAAMPTTNIEKVAFTSMVRNTTYRNIRWNRMATRFTLWCSLVTMHNYVWVTMGVFWHWCLDCRLSSRSTWSDDQSFKKKEKTLAEWQLLGSLLSCIVVDPATKKCFDALKITPHFSVPEHSLFCFYLLFIITSSASKFIRIQNWIIYISDMNT